MNKSKITIISLVSVILSGCAAMLVPETDDPEEKIVWAAELFDRQQRPLPAEKLILEAIQICKASKNYLCLGRAYSTYGFFFRSRSLTKWEKFYRDNGFLDKTATMDNRYLKSKEYFEASIENYNKTEKYDALTSAYLNLGFAYSILNDLESECAAYDKSLEYNRLNLKQNPGVKVFLPDNFSTYEEYLDSEKVRAGCK
ncbi:hypothetical protein [Spongorhabdus nitratireducens]